MKRHFRRRGLAAAGMLYLLLLGASHLARRGRDDGLPPVGKSSLEVAEQGRGARAGRRVRVAYRAWGEAAAGNAGAVLLLHGSPGSSGDFRTLGPLLADGRWVLAPDLPGFGHSERRLPDYSIAAHAEYALALLDRLAVDEVDLVGFSMGGGVALEMAARQPERVRSLTLLSSIGVQELELLGSHLLNHALHAVQLAALWALHEATPHFGRLDRFPLDVPYARNFFDTDQRPLRGILTELEMPVLIVHGDRDPLVPPSAAHEHYRLVPHSEIVMLSGSHFMVFRDRGRLATPIDDFLERVAAGTARHRAAASAERVAAARRPFDPSTVPAAAGLALLTLLGLIALATLVSEDITCIATGLLVSQGRLGLIAGSAACGAGILIGDLLIYGAGRYLGRPWLGRRPLKWIISPRALARSSDWFARRGPAVIIGSRFLPGTRVATYFAAGLVKSSFWRFLLYFSAAVLLWTPLLVGLASWLGARVLPWFELFQRWAVVGAVVLAVAVWLLLKLAASLSSWAGRRRLLGALRRKLEWEFWPPWALYLPLVPWLAWLALRHGGPTVFTAANPGIEAGGFIGESKASILDNLAPGTVAAYRRIDAARSPAERFAEARRFLAERSLDLPVVIKPDVGERGRGVTIVRSESRLRQALAAIEADGLIQEFVAGPELGIFYARRPGDERGRIFSITDKRLPRVVGDGVATLEQLILRDERAMRMAPTHLDRLADDVDRVPAAGEEVPLVEVGTHRLGALFLDGERRRTPALEEAVEEISRSFPGFFFGRYDLRAPSYEAFQRGEQIKVVELNGVTSEATHIYDPGNGLLDAQRVLRRQWSLAFEIGAANRARGVRPTGLLALLRLLARRASRRHPAPPSGPPSDAAHRA
jgi:pimeloyl-ACP methyl ester carboxylesterase/membrane protein DedA with SNARE-associated domain